MKTLISTSYLNVQSRIFLGLMLLFFSGWLQGQTVDCNTTMACNDAIQASLGDQCEIEITPDMILEDAVYDDSYYTVTISDLQGNILPSNIMNYSHVNQTFNASVSLNNCPTSCWGTVTIEDKLAPVITNCDSIIVDCDANLTPGSADTPKPTAYDACSFVTSDYTETSVQNGCANDFIKTITRNWVFSDEQGNESNCAQVILIKKATLNDIVWPHNYDGIDLPFFTCDTNLDLLPNGAPSPEETGFPGGVSCPNIQYYYNDIIFPLCGASIKVLRQWTVLDWCTGQDTSYNQIVKIIDNQPPVVTNLAPDYSIQIPTDPDKCTGTYEVAPPTIIFECSDYTYTVGYKLKDEYGQPFEDPIYDNINYNSATGLYTISGLPQDTSWIVYTITDACGYTSETYAEVVVYDPEAPTPVCDGYTVVSLEDEGWADVYAESIDDGSWDNCMIDHFEVKRETTNCDIYSDLNFGEKVNFCCNDVGKGYIKVTMRVFDKAGNFNDCIVNVTVQDKIDPVITCPANITLNCDIDYNDLIITGEATATDNCSAEITYTTNDNNLNDCGLGVVIRTWKATDPQGRTDVCKQRITMKDLIPFGPNNITWPGDMTISGCASQGITPEELNSFPILSNTDCANIAVSFDDQIYNNIPGYCTKVLRYWKIVDWCNFDQQNPYYFEHVQKIIINNSIAPVFEECQNLVIPTQSLDCEEIVTIDVNATDDCTAPNKLKYTWSIDLNSDGTIEDTGISNSLTKTFGAGTHTITWTVKDECDNQSTCQHTVKLKDEKAPSPICQGSVTWTIGEDGTAVVWASDFDLKSEDGCTPQEDLIFSFNEAGTQPSLTFDCSDIEDGILDTIPLQMWVIDQAGNAEYCEVELILFDSPATNGCPDNLGGQGMIAGKILNTSNDPMEELEVHLMNMDSQEESMEMTEDAGFYMFDEVGFYNDYSIKPQKNDDYSNGVSTLDLVMIQRHILELSTFDSPYKIIAADINGDDKVSSSDLVILRKVILGITEDFGQNSESWRFIPTTYEFPDPNDPFGFPEKVTFDQLTANQMHTDFTAIKVGDINGNASALKGDNTSESRSESVALTINNLDFEKGQHVTVKITAGDLKKSTGLQMALQFDETTLKYGGINGSDIGLTSKNVHLSGNHILFSWNDIKEIALSPNTVIAEIEFEAIKSGNTAANITVNKRRLPAESYNENLQIQGLTLKTRSVESTLPFHNQLLQNTPNPFNGMTTIGFELEKSGLATLSILDIAGKELYKLTDNFTKGYHEITLDMASISHNSGVFYYRLQTNGYIATKKMIQLD